MPARSPAADTFTTVADLADGAGDQARLALVTAALRLVTASVLFGLLAGGVSVVSGLQDHSLGVLAIGLGVMADVTGSAVLIWRFRAERRQPARSDATENRAAIVVSAALAIVSAVLIVESAAALAAAGASLLVLTPLAYAKCRLGRRMCSRALQGDGVLSGIGAATSLLAFAALVLDHALGWWWADRIAALIVAAVAAAHAYRTGAGAMSSP